MHKPPYTLSLQLIQNENICKHKMTKKPQIPLEIRQKGHKQPNLAAALARLNILFLARPSFIENQFGLL